MRALLALCLLATPTAAQDAAETRLFAYMTRAYAAEFASLREGILEAELLNACGSEEANARIDELFLEELRLKKALIEKITTLDLGGLEAPEERRARANLYLEGFAFADAT
ncbi:MAG: hypothetical protein AAFY59_18940, partial [Pseudomonadota bacterium]